MTKLPLFFLFLFLFLNLQVPIYVRSQTLHSQRSTLLSIKNQWGNLPALSTWSPATSPCSWEGIQCSSSATTNSGGGEVTGISLYNANITSHIPPSICDLKTLKKLDLSWNNIPGGFPTALYGCSALTHLDLSGNLFMGPIPNDVDKLSPASLQYLNISANNFKGNIPKSIGGLKELQTLDLNNNVFNGIYPPEISNLSKLEVLIMAGNPYGAKILPPEWGNLKNLRFLFMKYCNLVGQIPESFNGLVSLQHLDLAGNELVGKIPDGLFLLKDLEIVYLYNNQLSGDIPSSVQALNLTDLDLSNNTLSGSIPEGFGKLNRLRYLNLFDNNLSGEIPQSIGLLPELEYLKLFSNNLSGPLPPELGLHSSLRTVEIGSNRFSGPLPENLCSKGALIGITAFSNNLSGEIPKSLESCSTLRTLMIYNNSFTGEIPAGVWTLTGLYNLLFAFNGFTGHLPNQIAANMTLLDVSNNKFLGQIPSGIASWTNIQVLMAGNNMLSGVLPSGLTQLSRLITLSLEGNRLSGELPLNMNSWASLSKLDLARNEFSGPIPAAIGTLPTLNELDLSSNELSGEIPDQFEGMRLTVLNLSNNKLWGKIPHSLDNAAFATSFLNNTNLCTSDTSQIPTLPRCSSSFSSKHLSASNLLTMIFVIGVIAFSVTLWCTVFTIKRANRRKTIYEHISWKFTPFHILEFTEADIISSLSDQHVIGSGGSGTVYRVQFDNLPYFVAVKRIGNNHKLDNAQFIAEVEALGSIRHANIVKLLCCISSEKSKLLVYEYMENQSLDRWLHRRKRLESERRGNPLHVLNWPTRLKIAIGAAQGLCYMHHGCASPIIHRDIKSSNILLDSEFNAKIADFGLAKMTLNHGKVQTVSSVVGSFGYFAPEYQRTSKVNEKIDVYSFGVVLLELATGKEPNNEDYEEGVNLAQWSEKHCSEGKAIINALDEEVVQQDYLEEMSRVFILGLMCTSPSPDKRPSMKAVLEVLRQSSLIEDGSGRLKIVKINHVIDFNSLRQCSKKR